MNILINRSDAIGDVILTMPMAKLLKQKYPDGKITFLISKKCEDLFLEHPYIDEFRVLESNQSFFKRLKNLWHLLKELKPDTYIHVGGSHLPSFLAWLKGVKFRGGLMSKWQSFLFLNKGVRQKRSMVAMHESDYNLSLLAPLGLEYQHDQRAELRPEINLTDVEISKAKEAFLNDVMLENLPTNKELFFVHPGMTGHTLNWSSRNYGRLVKRVESVYPDRFLFVLSHTPSDEPFLEGFRQYLNSSENQELLSKVYFFNGIKRGLRDYMGVLKNAALFVGPSTGTTHIANCLGVKQVGIYSPIKVQSAMRWGPFVRKDSHTHLIVPDVVCGEQFVCAGNSCPYYECMAKIEVEDVFGSVRQLLENK